MNEDEIQVMEPQAGESLERMLARYARVRLDPRSSIRWDTSFGDQCQ